MSSAKIKVAIRMRPFLQSQIKNGYQNTRININSDQKIITVKSDNTNINKTFQFDHTFNQNSTQEQVYKGCGIQNLIDRAIQGYHSTIFAYGQTGSGKTYSMQGIQTLQTQQNSKIYHDGIIPRVINSLYQKIKAKSIQKTFTVSVSYLQIYNQKIFDLLNPSSLNPKNLGSDIGGLRLRWNKNQQFNVQNLFIFQCKNSEELFKFFNYGLKNRINSSHKLNMTSSRSHTILSIRVQSFDHKNPNQILTSRLQLVDLAGSQRIGLTGTQGKLAKQSIDINKSLFTLRQVISTLAQWNKNKPKQQLHIPYRQSKLTSILKQSIGGNSYCLMIACITPNDNFFDQNISTLTYATKATMITNKPTINDDPRNKVITQLKSRIKQLNQQLLKANKHIEIISSSQYNYRQTQNKEQAIKKINNQKEMISQLPVPVFRKKISEKINSGTYDQFSDRLVQSINMVRQLLKSNKSLREQLQVCQKNIQQKQIQIYDLEKQNQRLREKIIELTNNNYNGFDVASIKKINKPKLYSPITPIIPNIQMNLLEQKKKFISTAINFKPANTDKKYNTFNSIQINQFYLNETGMDSMPTNFNPRQINTANQPRQNSNIDRYRNTFTSSMNKRDELERLGTSMEKRMSMGYKNVRNTNQFY